MKKKYFVLIAVFVFILLAGWGGYEIVRSMQAGQEASTQELVVYSGRKEPLILPILRAFESRENVRVTVKYGSTEELANLLLQEKDASPADILIGTDASLLQMLSDKGFFAPVSSERLASIPPKYRAIDNTWTGVSGRSRVLIVNTDLVSPEEFPSSMYDIVQSQWRGKVAMAKLTNESVVTHMSAIRLLRGDAFLAEFLRQLKANDVALLPGHTDVRQAVARGEYAVGVVNHYYGHLQQAESQNIEIIYPDQAEGMDGVLVNVAAVGVVNTGKNSNLAQSFVHFLLTEETQGLFGKLNYEYPLAQDVPAENTRAFDDFRHVDVSLSAVAPLREKTLEIIREAGF